MFFPFKRVKFLGTALALALSAVCLGGCAGSGEIQNGENSEKASPKSEAYVQEDASESVSESSEDESAGKKSKKSSSKSKKAKKKSDSKKDKAESNKKSKDKKGSDEKKSKSKSSKSKSSKAESGSDKGTPIAEGTKTSSKSKVSMATWNLENFFDYNDDYYKDEVLTEREYADKLSRLSTVIKKVDADIIGVQEIETQQCLEDLAERSGYPYIVFYPGNDKIRGINVGVMSKIPVRNYVTHVKDRFGTGDSRGAFSRDCLEVHFKHTSNFTLLVNHLKSKLGGEASDGKRTLQAQRVAEIAGELKSFPVAICGDLNDEPDAKTLRPLTACSFLTDVLGGVDKSKRLSFFSKRYQSALDYIFVNDKLKPAVVPGSAHIYYGPDEDKASDHRPLKVEFDFSKIK